MHPEVGVYMITPLEIYITCMSQVWENDFICDVRQIAECYVWGYSGNFYVIVCSSKWQMVST